MKDLSRRALFGFLGAGVATVLGVSASQAQVTVYERVMPGARVEVIPAPPRPHWFWVPGHWAWRGGWVWVPGHYVRRGRPMPAPLVEVVPVRPSPRYGWVRGHWEWRDRRGDWVWVRGHWVR